MSDHRSVRNRKGNKQWLTLCLFPPSYPTCPTLWFRFCRRTISRRLPEPRLWASRPTTMSGCGTTSGSRCRDDRRRRSKWSIDPSSARCCVSRAEELVSEIRPMFGDICRRLRRLEGVAPVAWRRKAWYWLCWYRGCFRLSYLWKETE